MLLLISLYFTISFIVGIIDYSYYDKYRRRYTILNNPLRIDHYRILGLNHNATIRQIYIASQVSLKPYCVVDVFYNTEKPNLTDIEKRELKIINKAVEVLTDKAKREEYDKYTNINYLIFILHGIFWPFYLLNLFYNNIVEDNKR